MKFVCMKSRWLKIDYFSLLKVNITCKKDLRGVRDQTQFP